jgi:hypothetical protein
MTQERDALTEKLRTEKEATKKAQSELDIVKEGMKALQNKVEKEIERRITACAELDKVRQELNRFEEIKLGIEALASKCRSRAS